MVATATSAVAALGAILGVWAHPDDETYLSAGVMAAAVEAGQRVVCVNATRGEHGTPDPVRWPPLRLARTRGWEVAAAMAALGVRDHRYLGYEDGTLDTLDGSAAVARLSDLIADVEPDTILTFGPDGITGHLDHRTVSAWTTIAWHQTRPGARLLYATTTSAFADEFADLHERLTVFPSGLPVRTAAEDVALALTLDEALLDRKMVALRAQATQTAPVLGAMGEDLYRAWWRVETFRAPTAAELCDNG